ncbi:methyl-accepting chemotaxis protein [Izhakiella australiensis]|uniref:Methyl-accepting chemotaxis protein n=1 Tax=Izhakiella australiensis TaxID=1926881 RepID=A0A1S8Y9W7_9GAMM|nr:methyl-accepting chemotaxis protein [Izhakiella australiensis]OON35578.1 methyl-accepting chemotaxis protein [Izhakiella australiensis]
MTSLIKPGTQQRAGFWQNIRLVPLFALIFGVILLLFALCIGLASYFLVQSNSALKDVTEEIQVRTAIANSATSLRTARLNVIHAAANARVGDMDAFDLNLADSKKRIVMAQQAFNDYLNRRIKTSADAALDGELKTRFDAYVNQGLMPMIKAAANGSFEGVISQESDITRKLDDSYSEILTKGMAIRDLRAQQINTQARSQARLGYIMMGAAFAAAVLLTLITFVFLRQVVIAPLQRIVQRIAQIARGDLTTHEERWGSGEIGSLGSNLQLMQHSLVKTVGTVREGAVAIYQGSTEISSGNTDLSSRTEQQAAALQQTAASMEQLTATVKQNADNAHHASQLAADASGKALHGGEIVNGVVATMNSISTSSKKISEITSVINSIAFQTNILALNAAVEAARAGEQGRGFAVVASEVRNLAQRSAQAAKEIESLIAESVNLIGQGSQQVGQAGETMTGIVDAVHRVTDIMAEIAAASDEQSRGISQVSQAVTEMDSVTQQNAALVEQASAAAASLEDQASRLTQAVAVFQLQAQAASKAAPAVSAGVKPPAVTVQKPVLLASASGNENWETF